MSAPNGKLAERAADLARQAPRGSLERRAALCASVALSTTKTVTAARAALDQSDVPAEVRAAAIALLGELAAAPAEPAKRPEPLSPYEMGLRDARAALARGERPSREALAKVARILLASPALPQLLAAGGDEEGAAT